MAHNGTVAYVPALPECNFCRMDGIGSKAEFDFRTTAGPRPGSWAYGCEEHFRSFGPGRLGTGYGQHLVVQPATKKGEHTA